MRVAFLVNAFPVASETFVLGQISGIIDRGHDVDIYACDRGEDSNATTAAMFARYRLGERIRYLDVPRSVSRRTWRALGALRYAARAPRLYLRALNVLRYGRMAASLRLLICADEILHYGSVAYDVIHCQFGPLGNIALRLREIGAWRGSLVTAFRGYDATKVLQQSPGAYAELFRGGELFLPVSAALGDILVAHGCDTGKIEVHHSGIDCGRIAYRPRTLLPGERVRLISIARLVEKKGIDIAVRAVARLVSDGHDVEYDVIGDGPERNALSQLIAKLDLGTRVRLVGWRDHSQALTALDKAHILVAPSVTAADGDQEGIPNVLKEAMAMGLPVVATHHGGNAELVEHGVSGLLAPERDADALCMHIAALIVNAKRWPAIGLAGRRKVETEFDSQRQGAALEDIYRRAIERRAAACDRRGWSTHAASEVR